MIVPVILAGTLLTLGALVSGGRKKKSTQSEPDEVEALADELAAAEASGEVEVTEEGDVVEVGDEEPEAVEAVADDLAEREAAGEVAVSEDGEVTELGTVRKWNIPAYTSVRMTVEPDGQVTSLASAIRSRVPDVDQMTIKGDMVEVIAGGDDAIVIDSNSLRRLHGIPGTIVDVEILDGSEGQEPAPEEEEAIEAEVEAVADELAAAEEAGEIEVSEEGDVVEPEPAEVTAEVEAMADEIAAAEEAGQIEVDEEGEIETTVSGEAQRLADELTEVERTGGSLWKVALQQEVQEWQAEQGTDWKGAPMKPDGKFGPTSALTLANEGVTEIPLIRFWPSGSLQSTAVAEYKMKLQKLPGANAEAVKVALTRERGQGFGKARALTSAEVLS